MITTRIKPIRQKLSIAFDRVLGSEARAAVLAQQARRILGEADQRNAAALGQAPEHRTFVVGAATEAIERVRADGVVVRTYDVIGIDESRKERAVRPNAPRNLRNPAIIVRPR